MKNVRIRAGEAASVVVRDLPGSYDQFLFSRTYDVVAIMHISLLYLIMTYCEDDIYRFPYAYVRGTPMEQTLQCPHCIYPQ